MDVVYIILYMVFKPANMTGGPTLYESISWDEPITKSLNSKSKKTFIALTGKHLRSRRITTFDCRYINS